MCQYSVFYGEYENEKKTGQKKLTLPNGDLNPRFLNKFPPKYLNFEGDQMNRAHGSLKIWTLTGKIKSLWIIL